MSFSKNIRYLYIQIFFHHLIFAYVIERLFALERGMTVLTVVYCEIIYAAVTVLLEIPSGALADRFGRRSLLIAGAIFTVFEFAVLPFAHGFLLFGVSALVAAFGGVCISGARNALLYDSLKADGREDDFVRVLGRVQVVICTASLIAGLSGAVLAQLFGYAFNFWLSAASVFAALIITFFLKEPPKLGQSNEIELGFRAIIRTALLFFKEHTDILRIVLHATLIAACVNYMDEFGQVYQLTVSFPLALFGVVSAVDTLARAPGGLLAAWLLRRMQHGTVIFLSSLLIAAGLLWAAASQNIYGMIGMLLVSFAIELMEAVTAGYIHRRADPNARATIESVGSMLQRSCTIIVGLLFGYVSSRFNIFSGFWLLGIITGIACLVFAYYVLRNRTK